MVISGHVTRHVVDFLNYTDFRHYWSHIISHDLDSGKLNRIIFSGIVIEDCPLDIVNIVGVQVLNTFQSGLEYLALFGVLSNDDSEMYRSFVLGYAEPLWSLLANLDLVCYNGTSLVYHIDNSSTESQTIPMVGSGLSTSIIVHPPHTALRYYLPPNI